MDLTGLLETLGDLDGEKVDLSELKEPSRVNYVVSTLPHRMEVDVMMVLLKLKSVVCVVFYMIMSIPDRKSVV